MKKGLLLTGAATMLAHAALAANYTANIPAMGPARLPGDNTAEPGYNILRAEIVDQTGRVDWIFKQWGQNWLCLGTDNNPNNPNNYPAVAIFDIGPRPNFTGGHYALRVPFDAVPLAHVQVAKEVDWPVCAASGGSCYTLYTHGSNAHGGELVYAGDVLVWAVTHMGNNCPGQAYVNGSFSYPSAPGGEVTLGIHVTSSRE